MSYRRFDTGTWQDPWFEDLSPQAKLLFIYLWTNDVCNQAGMYQISKRRMEFEVGFKINKPMEELSCKVEWFQDLQVIWIKNFLKWQAQNSSFLIGAIKSIDFMPDNLCNDFISLNIPTFDKHGIEYKKHIKTPWEHSVNTVPPTVSTPCKDSDPTHPTSVTVTEAVTDTETETEKDSLPQKAAEDKSEQKPKMPTNSNGQLSINQQKAFDLFWAAYPRRKSKGHALIAWKKINPNEQLVETMISKIEQAKTSEGWTKDGGKFIPHPATWLNAIGWEDDYEPVKKPYSEKTARTIENLNNWMKEDGNEEQIVIQ